MEKVSSENKEGERERQSIILTMKTQTMVKNFAASGRKKNFLSEEMEGGGVINHSWKVSEVSTFIRKLDDAYIITL